MKNLFLEILFPKSCLGCNKPGTYLCQDCLSLIDISEKINRDVEILSGIFCACDYENFLVKKLIQKFKYKPFAKNLSKTLAYLIILHFKNLQLQEFFTGQFLIIPIPLSKKRLKWRGFNQAQEIAKHISEFLELPVINNVLIKTKQTLAQTDLPKQQRKQNLKIAFTCENPEIIKNKNILLIDDVFTTGATMIEAGKTLKSAGANRIYGIAVAKG